MWTSMGTRFRTVCTVRFSEAVYVLHAPDSGCRSCCDGNRPTQGVGLADRPARELLERTSDASLDPARSRRRDRRQVNTPPRYCSTHILGPRPTVKLRSELTKSWNAAATAMDATLKIGYKPSARCEESRRVHHLLCSRPSQGERHASAQIGLQSPAAKPLKGFTGAGVLEVVVDFDGNTFSNCLHGAVFRSRVRASCA